MTASACCTECADDGATCIGRIPLNEKGGCRLRQIDEICRLNEECYNNEIGMICDEGRCRRGEGSGCQYSEQCHPLGTLSCDRNRCRPVGSL